MKIIKTLHEWPLSNVELVEIDGKRFVLKTIHSDFANEVKKQKLLSKKCRTIKIPKIYWVKKSKGKVSFLMDYIGSKKKVNSKTALKIIKKFHKETKKVKSNLFKTYNFEAFYGDFLEVKKYLGDFGKQTKAQLKVDFSEIFNSDYSIVHGDWGKDQILGKNGEYIVDFGKSFYGPSILDYANFFLNDNKQNDKKLIKAKIVVAIITLRWLELCRIKYIKYNYKKEIHHYVCIINNSLKSLG
ncbi:MAG TPA: hypothetical protein VJ438_00860 [Candidatus Nanoarchaeia archaeon]|nr:hypothetical protein [Candidatus Nanoarchaeia archaeon]